MSTIESTQVSDFSQTDFCDPRVFDDPYELFSWLRSLDHLHYDERNDLYIAARHEDVFAVSRDDSIYCCKYGVRPKIAGDMSIITLDGDEHTRQRRLINKGFTPKRVRELIPHIRQLTNEIIDQVADRGEIDFVEDFAIHVPLIVICELLGLPPEQRQAMYRWSDDMMAGDGHVEADSPQLQAAAEAFGEYCTLLIELIAERRADPTDDLISILTDAFDAGALAKEFKAYQGVSDEELAKMATTTGEEVGEQLKDDELLAFLTILLVAGNETTRNALTGGIAALSLFPDQRQLLLENLDNEKFMELVPDELVRYVTPVIGFIRTVTTAHTLHNTDLKEGDRVLMLYGAANRDETVFDNPDGLDLTRDPNPHLGFGIGPHFCLGSNLAKAEIRVVLQELFRRLPDITVPEGVSPSRGDSTLVLALQELPATFTKCPVAH